jgi:hypothetical protein
MLASVSAGGLGYLLGAHVVTRDSIEAFTRVYSRPRDAGLTVNRFVRVKIITAPLLYHTLYALLVAGTAAILCVAKARRMLVAFFFWTLCSRQTTLFGRRR